MLQGGLGPLVEREFRALFLSVTISALGDAVATIALAFAILDLGSLTDLGIVIASRQVASSAAVLIGGVYGDRLPRDRVMVVIALVQAATQAATAAIVLGGSAALALVVPLQMAFGLADGFVQPVQTGIVPEVVSAERLQQANALMQTFRSGTWTVGPALGGILVAFGSPGVALAIDAASFLIAAALLSRLHLTVRSAISGSAGFRTELREGFRAFRATDWVWMSAIGFGVGNLATQSLMVLGPALSKRHYGGPGAWASTSTAFSVGMIIGGLVAMRVRPSRPFAACIVGSAFFGVQMVAYGLLAPLWVLVAAAAIAGVGLAIHLSLWFTVFQQEIAAEMQSRVSSFENLGSFVLNPIGTALAGPLAVTLGVTTTLVAGGAIAFAADAVLLLLPSVWAIQRVGGLAK